MIFRIYHDLRILRSILPGVFLGGEITSEPYLLMDHDFQDLRILRCALTIPVLTFLYGK